MRTSTQFFHNSAEKIGRPVVANPKTQAQPANTDEEEYDEWLPERPADQYSDEEVMELDCFLQLKDSRQGRSASNELLISITRSFLSDAWKGAQDDVADEAARSILDDLRERGLIGADIHRVEVYIDADTDQGKIKGSKKAKGKRFSEEDYISLVGRKFTRTVTNARERTSYRNGRYVLSVLAGHEGAEKGYVLKLEQFPDDEAKVPVIFCPPRDVANPVKGEDSVEVANPSKVMAASLIGITATPASWFKLREAMEANKDEEAKAKDDESDRPASNVHEVLDDEE